MSGIQIGEILQNILTAEQWKELKIFMLEGQTKDTYPEICRGELHICLESRNAWIGEQHLGLTKYGFDVLCLLARHPRRVFSKEQIYEHVWEKESGKTDNATRCVISGLRKKLQQYIDKEYIQTVRGIGYKFVIPEA